ncbi:MAG: glycosyltransferase family 2 protein [Egibacteraceae bacterium]
MTRDRLASLRVTLERLAALPERPPVVVVDNASRDGTFAAVQADHPDVAVVALPENRGAAARTVGARQVGVPYIAFSDDDSWWAPGALSRAAALFDAHPRLGLIAARILVGAEERLDPACTVMAASSLECEPDLPGPPVLGFVACGAVVRRDAFMAAGGFHRQFVVGGEEQLLAIDLAVAGWGLAYVDTVVAHHHPSPVRDPAARRRHVTRNDLWTSWLRRPAPSAGRQTLIALRAAARDPAARAGLLEALQGVGWVVRERRVVPAHLEAALRRLER